MNGNQIYVYAKQEKSHDLLVLIKWIVFNWWKNVMCQRKWCCFYTIKFASSLKLHCCNEFLELRKIPVFFFIHIPPALIGWNLPQHNWTMPQQPNGSFLSRHKLTCKLVHHLFITIYCYIHKNKAIFSSLKAYLSLVNHFYYIFL